MRICFFHSSMQNGGIERTIALLANMYVQKGDNVSIITMTKEESFYPLLPGVVYYKKALESESRGIIQSIINNIKRIQFLQKCLREFTPDVLVTFAANTELIGYIAKEKRTRLIGAERANPKSHSSGFWGKNTRKIALLCDGFLFQTKKAKSCYPISIQEKSLVIQNGVEAAICKRFDRPWAERKNICSVGRMDPEKGIDDVIRAFSVVAKTFPEVILDLYGDGPMRIQLEGLAETFGLADRIVFHGKCKTMLEEYSKHKVFLMMSHSEGFPNVLLEAMASSCVCVSSDCDFGPGELIHNNVNGVLVDVGDYQAAADAIIYFLQHGEEAKRLSENAKDVRNSNDISKVGMEIYSYLKEVISK